MPTGTITAVDAPRTAHSISGVAHKANSLTGAADITTDFSLTASTQYTFGSSGLDNFNQVVRTIFTATKNTTTTLNLNNTLTNVVGDALATFTTVNGFMFELLTTTQDSTNGTAITGNVTMQVGASNAINTGPLTSPSVWVFKPGDKLIYESHGTSSGITVSGTHSNYDFVNADTVVDGHFRITIWGFK